jgi:hypothetical protein
MAQSYNNNNNNNNNNPSGFEQIRNLLRDIFQCMIIKVCLNIRENMLSYSY